MATPALHADRTPRTAREAPPAAQPADPARARGDGLQAEVLGVGARLRLVGREAARALHDALPGLREALPARRHLGVLPARAPDRHRALHVLRRRHEPGDVLDRPARDAAAQALVPAARDPDLDDARRRDHVRREPRRRGCLHRLEPDPAAAQLAPARAASARALRLHPRGSRSSSRRCSCASATSARSGSSPRS